MPAGAEPQLSPEHSANLGLFPTHTGQPLTPRLLPQRCNTTGVDGAGCAHVRTGGIIIKQESENRTGFSHISPSAETREGATPGRGPSGADQIKGWGQDGGTGQDGAVRTWRHEPQHGQGWEAKPSFDF